MSIAYNAVVNAFLSKITEFEFIQIPEENRDEIILGYLRRAVVAFQSDCEYDLSWDDESKEFAADIKTYIGQKIAAAVAQALPL